ncbi:MULTISPECIES: toxin-antitoxin system YwqK family antitoxin [Pirellulaceae]|nr:MULTISPECIES: hypothetical protein [Pirellulaceae]
MTTSVLQDGSHIETPYVAGFARGVVRFYYPNGNLKYEGNEISGSREGKFKGYYETGEIWWAASFSDDEYVEGSAVVWDKDGNVLSIEPLEVLF